VPRHVRGSESASAFSVSAIWACKSTYEESRVVLHALAWDLFLSGAPAYPGLFGPGVLENKYKDICGSSRLSVGDIEVNAAFGFVSLASFVSSPSISVISPK
jgi:hypothetical protein